MKRISTLFAIAAALLIVARPTLADTCYETSTVNIDCSAKGPSRGSPTNAAPQNPKPDTSRLREELRRSLGSASTGTSRVSPEQLASRIGEAQARVDEALRDPAAPGARERYDGAMKDLRSAYGDAANAATPAGRAAVLEDLQRVEAHYGDLATRADWDGARATASQPSADAAQPAGNIAIVNGYVFVCDGPVDGAHATCREIQHDGRQCIAVMADEGVLGWRDSIDTPCSAADLQQRDEYLARHPDEAAIVSAAAMSNECRDLALNYSAAAEANNGPAAQAAYEAIRSAGGCGVLSKLQAQATPAAADPRFVSRGSTPMLDQTVVQCDQQPGACAQLVNQLRAGTSPEAVTALYSNAIAIGLELGAAMGQFVLSAQQMNMINATRPNMGSIGRPPVSVARRPTAAPVHHPAPAVPGCKIGGVGWCTAQ